MFWNVLDCSAMFRVRGFIDAPEYEGISYNSAPVWADNTFLSENKLELSQKEVQEVILNEHICTSIACTRYDLFLD